MSKRNREHHTVVVGVQSNSQGKACGSLWRNWVSLSVRSLRSPLDISGVVSQAFKQLHRLLRTP